MARRAWSNFQRSDRSCETEVETSHGTLWRPTKSWERAKTRGGRTASHEKARAQEASGQHHGPMDDASQGTMSIRDGKNAGSKAGDRHEQERAKSSTRTHKRANQDGPVLDMN